MRTRILLFLLGLVLVPSLTYLVILFARGYRPNFANRKLRPTGILVATSLPDGAQVLINSQLKSATDTSLNLDPGTYQVEIKKQGFSPWTKTLQIEAEIVTRAAATLFPTVPSLKAITTSGASSPSLSPDGTKIVYLSQTKLYTLDLSESPLGLLNRDSKLLYELRISPGYELIWSPDSKQVLAISTPSAQLIDLNLSSAKLIASPSGLLAQWNQLRASAERQKFVTLPTRLQEILATAAADLIWSPKENRLLYTATSSAIIPDNLIRSLPGSSTQPQSRTLTAGKTYTYDVEEDRNFNVQCFPQSGIPLRRTTFNIQWFSDSSHLICTDPGKITISEYDGTNPTVVYAGPMQPDFALPYPSGKQLLILTNLNLSPTSLPNLYAVSLR